jgi:hypothetical protein
MERRLLIFQSGGVEAQLLSKLDAQITGLVQTNSLGEAFMCHISKTLNYNLFSLKQVYGRSVQDRLRLKTETC